MPGKALVEKHDDVGVVGSKNALAFLVIGAKRKSRLPTTPTRLGNEHKTKCAKRTTSLLPHSPVRANTNTHFPTDRTNDGHTSVWNSGVRDIFSSIGFAVIFCFRLPGIFESV